MQEPNLFFSWLYEQIRGTSEISKITSSSKVLRALALIRLERLTEAAQILEDVQVGCCSFGRIRTRFRTNNSRRRALQPFPSFFHRPCYWNASLCVAGGVFRVCFWNGDSGITNGNVFSSRRRWRSTTRRRSRRSSTASRWEYHINLLNIAKRRRSVVVVDSVDGSKGMWSKLEAEGLDFRILLGAGYSWSWTRDCKTFDFLWPKICPPGIALFKQLVVCGGTETANHRAIHPSFRF